MSSPRVPGALRPLLTPVSAIHPAPHNPRTGHAVDAIARSLSELGWHAPIVARQDGEVIVGHGRLAAAHLLGLQEVPVLLVDDDRATAVTRMVADNRLTEMSSWSLPELEALMPELEGWSDDLDLLTFQPPPNIYTGEALDNLPDVDISGGDEDLLSERVVLIYDNEDEHQWLVDRLGAGADIPRRVMFRVKDLM